MQFEYPWVFFLLTLIPVLVYFRFYATNRNIHVSYTRTSVLAKALERSRSPFFHSTGLLAGLYAMSLAFFLVSLARPQVIEPLPPKKEDGLDIMVAIDVSPSMEALDFELQGKTVNRLQALQHVLGEFIALRAKDRFGLIVFGKAVFTQSPLSHDREMVQSFLKETYIGMVGDGTSIGDAIAAGTKRLDSNKSKAKILILLTDGRQTTGNIPAVQAAEAAKTLGVKVYAIGIGREGQVPYPVEDPFFGRRVVYRESDLDEKLLKQVAEITGGGFFRASDTESFKKIYREIDSFEKEEIKKANETIRHEKFRPPLLLGFCVFVLFLVLSSRRLGGVR